MNIKRAALTIGIVVLVLLGAWIAGFNFNERGGDAVVVYIVTVWCGGMVYLCPTWKERKSSGLGGGR